MGRYARSTLILSRLAASPRDALARGAPCGVVVRVQARPVGVGNIHLLLTGFLHFCYEAFVRASDHTTLSV